MCQNPLCQTCYDQSKVPPHEASACDSCTVLHCSSETRALCEMRGRQEKAEKKS